MAWTGSTLLGILMSRAPLAQLDRALDSDSKGQWFESTRAHQLLEIASIYDNVGGCSVRVRARAQAPSKYLTGPKAIPGDTFHMSIGREAIRYPSHRVPQSAVALEQPRPNGPPLALPYPR